MKTVKDLIERHSKQYPEFLYYLPIIEKAVRNEGAHPDITIECCNSLFQGISKTVILELDSSSKKKELDRKDTDKLIKLSLNCLKDHDDILEDDFVRRGVSLALAVSTLRNARGDISHGRAVPKELESDRSLSRLVMHTSEGLLRYMLASFYFKKFTDDVQVEYEDNKIFNDRLDSDIPLEGKPLYSLALYQQYYEDYLIQLEAFQDEQEMLDE